MNYYSISVNKLHLDVTERMDLLLRNDIKNMFKI